MNILEHIRSTEPVATFGYGTEGEVEVYHVPGLKERWGVEPRVDGEFFAVNHDLWNARCLGWSGPYPTVDAVRDHFV